MTGQIFIFEYYSWWSMCGIYSTKWFSGNIICLFELDRCKQGYTFTEDRFCTRYVNKCENHENASKVCEADGAMIGAPTDLRAMYIDAYAVSQQPIQIAVSDMKQEGVWKRDAGEIIY